MLRTQNVAQNSLALHQRNSGSYSLIYKLCHIYQGATQVAAQDLFVSSSNQNTKLGALATTGDGRFYRYASLGAVAAVPGKLYQAAAELTNHQNLAPTADAAVGDTSLTVTLGATAATANYYAGGFAMVTTSTGAGFMYEIASHPAADSAATL